VRCPHCPTPKDELCRGEQIQRFCQLVDPEHPDYNPEYKRILVRDDYVAGNYPAVVQQVRNLWRDFKAFVRSGGKLAPKALRRARLAVCEAPCEKWDKQQRRCVQCGCKEDVKVYSLVAKCPLGKWPQS
jgi:hypothetical protein